MKAGRIDMIDAIKKGLQTAKSVKYFKKDKVLRLETERGYVGFGKEYLKDDADGGEIIKEIKELRPDLIIYE